MGFFKSNGKFFKKIQMTYTNENNQADFFKEYILACKKLYLEYLEKLEEARFIFKSQIESIRKYDDIVLERLINNDEDMGYNYLINNVNISDQQISIQQTLNIFSVETRSRFLKNYCFRERVCQVKINVETINNRVAATQRYNCRLRAIDGINKMVKGLFDFIRRNTPK